MLFFILGAIPVVMGFSAWLVTVYDQKAQVEAARDDLRDWQSVARRNLTEMSGQVRTLESKNLFLAEDLAKADMKISGFQNYVTYAAEQLGLTCVKKI